MEVYSHIDLPGEFANSKYTRYLRNKKQDRFRAKLRTANSFNELVKIATNRKWEKARHTDNKDAKYGVYKYRSRFAFPVFTLGNKFSHANAYACDLVIINASDGNKYSYDIQNIKEDTLAAGELSERRFARDNMSQPDSILNRSISKTNEQDATQSVNNLENSGDDNENSMEPFFDDESKSDATGVSQGFSENQKRSVIRVQNRFTSLERLREMRLVTEES